MKEPRELMDHKAMDEALRSLAVTIAKGIENPEKAALVGVRTRGVPLARRIHKFLAIEREWNLPLGRLDITLYRDDLSTLDVQPLVRESDLPFDVDGRTIILVDDVLYTGRTTRAAIDALIAFGRPAAIRLAVLVDRGLREYPIQADYCGLKVETQKDEAVYVRVAEVDGADSVVLARRDDDWDQEKGAMLK